MKALRLGFIVAAIAAWFLLCGLVFGADPPVVQATANGPVLVLTPTLPAGSGAVWRVTSTKAGTWQIILVTASNGQPAIFDGSLTLTFGSLPTPPVPPTPDPPVPPTPTPDKPVALYLIYESKDLTPATTAVRDALPWKAAADKAGIRWLCFDQDEGAKKFPEATKRAQAVGLPAVVFLDAKGVPDVAKAPATAAAMEALVALKVAAKGKGGK